MGKSTRSVRTALSEGIELTDGSKDPQPLSPEPGSPNSENSCVVYQVVLSACNSGMGKIKSEGVIGLSRAFLVAGCQHSAPGAETDHTIVKLNQA